MSNRRRLLQLQSYHQLMRLMGRWNRLRDTGECRSEFAYPQVCQVLLSLFPHQ